MNFKEKFLEILNDTNFILKNNLLPVSSFKTEKKIDEYNFEYTVSKEVLPEQKLSIPKDKNFLCKLCPNKISHIKTFEHIGKIPSLVLHFTGEIRKNQSPFLKTKSSLIFKNENLEDLFDRLSKKALNRPMKDFYFQEFPACIFPTKNSSDDDWKNRISNCEIHVVETLEKNQINSILFLGASAVLFYGKERAQELTGKLVNVEFGGKKYPSMVLRSPEGILSLEEKRKSINIKKYPAEFEKAKGEEDKVKKETLEHFIEFCKQI